MLSYNTLEEVHHQDNVIINQNLGVFVSTQNPIRQHLTHFGILKIWRWKNEAP